MQVTANLGANAEATSHFRLPAKESLTYAVANTAYSGDVVLEKGGVGGQFWIPIVTIPVNSSGTYVNHSGETETLRLVAKNFVSKQTISFGATPDDGALKLSYGDDDFEIAHSEGAAELQAALRLISGLDQATVSGTYAAGFLVTFTGVDVALVLEDNTSTLEESASPVAVTIAEVEAQVTLTSVDSEVVETIFQDKKGKRVLGLLDDGKVLVETNLKLLSGVNDINSFEEITTNGDAAESVDLSVYQTQVTSGGSEGDEDLEIGDGTGAIVGQRKLITFVTRTHASDAIVLDDANFSVTGETITAIELDAENEFILVEWQGAAWEVIAATSGVVTSS